MLAAPQPLEVNRFRVEAGDRGFSMPCVTLRNRRAGGQPMVRWLYQRHLEMILYGRTEGSSGPIWKILSSTGMGVTALAINKAAVSAGHLTQTEFDTLMRVFKEALPADIVDPSSLGRIRNCTLLPLATAAAVVRSFGRSPMALAFLRAFSQQVPEAWSMHEEREALRAQGQVDLALEEQIEAQGDFEAEELSFAEELTRMPAFAPIQDDEARMSTYILQRVPPILKSELDAYITYRTATFAARRQGGAVQSISAEADKTALLRFLGYLQRTNRMPEGASLNLFFLLRADLGSMVQEYASWLQNDRQCRFSSIANYLNGLVSMVSYAYGNLEPSDAVLNSDPNPLAQIINLRAQAEKASKTQQMYDERVGGFCTWEDVQKARVKAIEKLGAVDGNSPPQAAEKRFALRDACALSLLSLIPPDRVGCIRKLRLNHTLKRKEGASGWKMDLSKQRDGHKTSRFYGPFAASLPEALTPILDAYTRELEYDGPSDGPYLFHPPHSHSDRPMEPSAWTGWVRRLFQRHHGSPIAPKTLRSVFITWLRDSTSAPDILKSAAHAMKHSEARQGSAEYDKEKDDRLVKASYDFNLTFAAKYKPAGVEMDATGGAAAVGAADGELGDVEVRTTANLAVVARPMCAAAAAADNAMDASLAMTSVAQARALMASVAECSSTPVVALPVTGRRAGSSSAASSAVPLAAASLADVAASRCCNFLACTLERTEGLRECPCGAGPHHHICSINAGCEEQTSLCASCLGAPRFAPGPAGQAVSDGAGSATDRRDANGHTGENGASGASDAHERAGVDDANGNTAIGEGWERVPGGPFVARLCKKSSQPPAQATYRRYYVVVPFDAQQTSLPPGGFLRFPIVPGAPAKGITCKLPTSWPKSCKELIFTLHLSKAGATEPKVTVHGAFCRRDEPPEAGQEEENVADKEKLVRNQELEAARTTVGVEEARNPGPEVAKPTEGAEDAGEATTTLEDEAVETDQREQAAEQAAERILQEGRSNSRKRSRESADTFDRPFAPGQGDLSDAASEHTPQDKGHGHWLCTRCIAITPDTGATVCSNAACCLPLRDYGVQQGASARSARGKGSSKARRW